MSDYWQEWERRNVAEQAQAQIAKRDLAFQNWVALVEIELAYYEKTENWALVEQYRANYEQAAQMHAVRLSMIQQDAEQQIAEIDQRHADSATQHERWRERWLSAPTNTPRSPLPDWSEHATPAPAYGPRNVVDTPLDTSAPDAPEQDGSILDTLRAWFG